MGLQTVVRDGNKLANKLTKRGCGFICKKSSNFVKMPFWLWSNMTSYNSHWCVIFANFDLWHRFLVQSSLISPFLLLSFRHFSRESKPDTGAMTWKFAKWTYKCWPHMKWLFVLFFGWFVALEFLVAHKCHTRIYSLCVIIKKLYFCSV